MKVVEVQGVQCGLHSTKGMSAFRHIKYSIKTVLKFYIFNKSFFDVEWTFHYTTKGRLRVIIKRCPRLVKHGRTMLSQNNDRKREYVNPYRNKLDSFGILEWNLKSIIILYFNAKQGVGMLCKWMSHLASLLTELFSLPGHKYLQQQFSSDKLLSQPPLYSTVRAKSIGYKYITILAYPCGCWVVKNDVSCGVGKKFH